MKGKLLKLIGILFFFNMGLGLYEYIFIFFGSVYNFGCYL